MIRPRLQAFAITLSSALALTINAVSFSQSDSPAIFVGNNGNLEGSVTSMLINPDNTLTFVQKLVTGTTPSTSNPVPGTNAAVISITPNGRFLAVGHQTGLNIVEQVTIIEIASDATISIFHTFSTPDSPLDLQWLSDTYLAVMHTDLSAPNEVIVYEFDAKTSTLTEIDSEPTGSFSTALALHPSGTLLYAQDSTNRTVTAFSINPDGTLDHIETQSSSPTYPLGIGVSADGKWLYGGGGISNGGDKIVAFSINKDGSLDPIPGTPFISPGASPKQVITTADSAFALVAHGTDSTIRSFAIDEKTGALTATGFLYDIGFQGSLGEIIAMGDLLFAADRDTLFDDVRGIRTFQIGSDGAFNEIGTITDTQGIAPNSIAVWQPELICLGDFVSSKTFQPPPDGQVDAADLAFLLGEWGSVPKDGSPADMVDSATFQPPPDGVVDAADLAFLLGAWGVCE